MDFYDVICQAVVCSIVTSGGIGVEFIALTPHEQERVTAWVIERNRASLGTTH